MPEPPELSEDELARQRRNVRRWGWAFVVICFVIAAASALVMLTINRDTADLGAHLLL